MHLTPCFFCLWIYSIAKPTIKATTKITRMLSIVTAPDYYLLLAQRILGSHALVGLSDHACNDGDKHENCDAACVVLGAYEIAVIVVGVARATLIDVYLDTVEVCTVCVLVIAATDGNIVHSLAARALDPDSAGGVLPACRVVWIEAYVLVARIAAVLKLLPAALEKSR